MKTLITRLKKGPAYAQSPNAIYFDIETTGLSARGSMLYLIGIISWENNGYVMTQWLNDDGESEATVIEAFLSVITSDTILIHYNGSAFDLPYLIKKCTILDIPNKLSTVTSKDLYKRILPYKKILKLSSLKLTSLLSLLHIDRLDLYTGKELINVYFLYLKLQDTKRENDLLLHNKEDLFGLLILTSLLTYDDLFEGNYPYEIKWYDDCLFIQYQLPTNIPIPFTVHKNGLFLEVNNKTAALRIPILEMELKYFYEDYKDYYYLPLEDTAIHKSVASFVDNGFKQKAKASNCYIKKQGSYLFQPSSMINPVFKDNYKSKESYFLIDETFSNDKELLFKYQKALLEFLKYNN